MSSADDYAWFEVTAQGLSVESCLTFVKGLTAEEVTRRLGGAEVARITGLDRMERYREAVTVPAEAYGEDGSFDFEASTGREFAAVADLPGGALIVEQYGFLGTVPEVSKPLSRGASVAVVYTSENNDPSFTWAEDGDVRVTFDPYHAAWREGSRPDALLDVMQRLGFNFSTAEVDDPGWVFDDKAPGRAFALAEHVTGIRLTEEVLTEPTYLAVSVPSPWHRATTPGASTDGVPPIHIKDAAPTVDVGETMDLRAGELPSAEIGQPMTVEPFAPGGYDYAVRYTVRRVEQARDADPSPDELERVWLLVDVEATGVRGDARAQPHDFAFVAADRSRYRPIGLDKAGLLDFTVLRPGEHASGLVLFHLPPDVPGAGAIVIVNMHDEPIAYWSVGGSPARYAGPEKYPWP
jgi:hypothetical protein